MAASLTQYKLVVVDSPIELARQTADMLGVWIDLALAQRDRCQIALAGGESPRAAYDQLGQRHLAWNRVDVFVGDERWVDSDDLASNARMVRETLLAQSPAAAARFHPVDTTLPAPDAGARAYAELLEQLCGGAPPKLDALVLGLGDDGHTASLFPGTPATEVTDRSVTTGLGKGLPRITLTAPTLSSARQVLFLVSGSAKQQALQRLIDPTEPFERTPAKRVQPSTEVLILADRAAAALVA